MKEISGEEFEGLLDGVLREAANPEVRDGFDVRMRQAVLPVVSQAGNEGEGAMANAGVLVGGGLQEVGVFGSLWASLRDLVARPRMAPLVLASRPVAVVDRMAERRGMGPVGWAIAAHGVAILLVGFGMASRRMMVLPARPDAVAMVEAPTLPKVPPRAQAVGGGGGQKSPTPVAQGRLPKFAETQLVAPKAPALEQPKIAIEPTVVMQKDLKMADSSLPNLGMPNSPTVGTGSLGNGFGTGIGTGNGSGVGLGSGGNTGGGAMRIGGGVSAPVPVFMPDPEFSEEARKAKVSGNVLVYLWVDQAGRPTHVRIIRGIGMGLDEKAIAAVRQYRFKPAFKDSKPVTVEMNVEVNFQIF
ncbi:energy transducer TonB [Granulicella sibirica]|uniref:Ferric siderophore transport system, periplasmic binding protein TonB n=1 Tax=Granulicella sibirica TaxID=2479048 RepID=A0A4Q0T860_9BACT|nr:energy transducer TonB [Granulicella sibirica]RXH57896.1 Ferric siderophore transport system, periplasmic binding protein TonB [Granulicella sibirica]